MSYKYLSIIAATTLALSFCSCTKTQENVTVECIKGKWYINAYGNRLGVNGVGGTYDLATAANNGANACRTWGGNIKSVHETIDQASANGMYVMQGIGLPKDAASYSNPEFKAKTLEQCAALAEEFKDDKSIIIWGIGNEIDLDGEGNIAEAWSFVDEIARTMKAIDPNHLYSTVISYNKKALDLVAEYAPNLDLVGINCYGGIEELAQTVADSKYKGPYLVTEWGPTGWWEIDTTSWGAPIEQTSEQKREVYEYRYNVIVSDPRCMGSFCFLWGQKEERTPTWFCMFVERGVEGLPLNAEKTPMIEAMQRSWTGTEPKDTAPVVESMTANGIVALDSPTFAKNSPVTFEVKSHDRENDIDHYIWEVLYEATVTATGGAWEPRPERIGEVVTTTDGTFTTEFKECNNYRIYCYILDKSGYAATVNIPIRVE